MSKETARIEAQKRLLLVGIMLCCAITALLALSIVGGLAAGIASGLKPAHTTPVVFVLASDDSIHVLRVRDGKLLLHYQLDRPPYTLQSQTAPAPVLDNDRLYYDGTDGVYATNIRTGTLLWYRHLTSDINASDITLQEIEGVLYARYKSVLYAIRPSDGMLLWQRSLSNPSTKYFSLQETQGVLYYQDLSLLAAIRAKDGSLLWQNHLTDTQTTFSDLDIPIIDNGTIYTISLTSVKNTSYTSASDTFYTISAWRTSDGLLLWKHPEPAKPQISAPVDGVLYASVDGDTYEAIYAYRASDGSLLWERKGIGSDTTMQISDGVIYVANSQSVYALRISDHSQIWYSLKPASILDVKDGIVYTDSGALRADDGTQLWEYEQENFVQEGSERNIYTYHVDFKYAPDNPNNLQNITSYMSAHDSKNGSLLWSQRIYDGGPLSFGESNGILFVSSRSGWLYAFVESTGAFLWQYDFGRSSIYNVGYFALLEMSDA